MDIVDEAQALEERQREAALAAHGAQALPVGDWEQLSAKWCQGPACGERIPDERRRAIPGVELCVECQKREEKEMRRRGTR